MITPIGTPEVTTAEMQAILDMLTPLVINMAPTEGQTINLPNTSQEIILNLNPAAPLTAVNIVLPNDASSRTGERLFVASTKAIDTATFSGTPIVNNNVVTFAPGDNVVFFKNNTNTWSRLVG